MADRSNTHSVASSHIPTPSTPTHHHSYEQPRPAEFAYVDNQHHQQYGAAVNVNMQNPPMQTYNRHAAEAAAPAPPPPRKGPKPSVLGNGHRCCGNLCICAKDGKFAAPTLAVAVTIPVVVFLTSIEDPSMWWSHILCGVLYVLMLLMLLFATTCDPGILIPEQPDENKKDTVVNINGHDVECKVCTTCHILRPPRSSHCQFCDWCVEEYDHHCGVLGSCVAKRTFRFFAGFMWVGTLLSIYVFVRTVMFLASHDLDELQKSSWGRWQVAAGVLTCMYTIFAFCCLSSQGGYYCQLTCQNTTQKDMNRLEHYDRNTGLPKKSIYDKGKCANFCERIFGPLGKSRIESHHV